MFAQETEVMVRRVLMGLLQAWNHGFHVCLFPSSTTTPKGTEPRPATVATA